MPAFHLHTNHPLLSNPSFFQTLLFRAKETLEQNNMTESEAQEALADVLSVSNEYVGHDERVHTM